jgi:hypothetical protein
VWPECIPLNILGLNTMSKGQHSNREMKKKPAMTPKEKKAAKQAKKQQQESTGLFSNSRQP